MAGRSCRCLGGIACQMRVADSLGTAVRYKAARIPLDKPRLRQETIGAASVSNEHLKSGDRSAAADTSETLATDLTCAGGGRSPRRGEVWSIYYADLGEAVAVSRALGRFRAGRDGSWRSSVRRRKWSGRRHRD